MSRCIVEHDLNQYLDRQDRLSWIAEQATTVRKRCEECGQFFSQEVNEHDERLKEEFYCPPCKRPHEYRWVKGKRVRITQAERDAYYQALVARSPLLQRVEGARNTHIAVGSLAPVRRTA
jgi:hypothetical protein